jgi:hypothetical protein
MGMAVTLVRVGPGSTVCGLSASAGAIVNVTVAAIATAAA